MQTGNAWDKRIEMKYRILDKDGAVLVLTSEGSKIWVKPNEWRSLHEMLRGPPVINLEEDELRIYDPARPERCKRFSSAVDSGTYIGSCLIDSLEHPSVIGVHFRP